MQADRVDMRARVLMRDAIGEPDVFFYADGRKYRVMSGTWIDAFSGRTHDHVRADRMHVDHLIPVCFAWARGAQDWTYEERRAFFNDESLLMVVAAGLNGSKGARPPWEFLPSDRDAACTYSLTFREGMERYGLTMSDMEHLTLAATIQAACTPLSADVPTG